MTRISASGSSRPVGLAYFIRRCGDECAVIELQSGDREEVIASALAPGAAEDLCASRIEALPKAAPAAPGPIPDRCLRGADG